MRGLPVQLNLVMIGYITKKNAQSRPATRIGAFAFARGSGIKTPS
jgi:hypothetical protein